MPCRRWPHGQKGSSIPKGWGNLRRWGDNAEEKFRLWSVKLEDYVYGVYGGKVREILEWASTSDAEVDEALIDATYGINADPSDEWDDVYDFNGQLYSVLRATTEGIPFDVVENVPTGHGLEAWRCLHRRFDPATGSRKRIMLNALTNPEKATYETLPERLGEVESLEEQV